MTCTLQHVGGPAALDAPSRLRALVCDAAGTLVDGAGSPLATDARAALDQVRAAGLLLAVVHDEWPSVLDATLLGPVDLVAVPRRSDRTVGRHDEVRPQFVRRTCHELGADPTACVFVGGRRPLLAAAAWAGARTVMVPNDATPPFDVRGQRHVVPDLATAVASLLAEVVSR